MRKKKKKKKKKEKKKKRKTKEKIPVMNGGCSRFNESPRWSSMGNRKRVRGKRSRRLEIAQSRKKKEKRGEEER